jgi:hypothetical protein
MADETDEAAVIRRLQLAAPSYRRTDRAVADDLEAAVQYKQFSPEQREEALARDPSLLTLIKRLEKRAQQAIEENQSPLADDLLAATELIRGL